MVRMKTRVTIAAALFAVGTGQVAAAPERIGTSYVLEVPAPAGFVKVTPDMSRMYPYAQSFNAPPGPGGVDLVATYIPSSLEAAARRGELPEMEQWCLLQVVRQIRDVEVTVRDFAKIKPTLVTQLKEQGNEMLSQGERVLEGQGDRVMKALEIPGDEGSLKMGLVSSAVLKPHDVGETHVGFSAFMRYRMDGTAMGGETLDEIIAMTTYMGLAGERMIQQICYGSQSDLQWTREAAKAWSARTQAANP